MYGWGFIGGEDKNKRETMAGTRKRKTTAGTQKRKTTAGTQKRVRGWGEGAVRPCRTRGGRLVPSRPGGGR